FILLHPPPRYTLFPYTTLFRANSDNNSIRANHRFEANLEWNISDKDYIKLTPQFGIDNNDGRAFDNRTIFFGDVLNNIQRQQTMTETYSPRYSISGLYNRKLNDKGRNLFLNFNYDNRSEEHTSELQSRDN